MESVEERMSDIGEIDTPFQRWMTIGDVGHALGISTQRVQAYVQQGRFRFMKTPLGKLFDPVSVEDFKNERKQRRESGDGNQ